MIRDDAVDLLPMLRCPATGDPLARVEGGLAAPGGPTWPLENGRPCFLDAPLRGMDLDRLSHPLPPRADALIRGIDGPVLNLAAGNSHRKHANVIEVEIGAYRHTDVVSDAHVLPFRDNAFDGFVCLNSFEHFHSPDLVVAEIRRVLKPKAPIYVETANLQPLHMQPHHFFNATVFGVARWFRDFGDVKAFVPDNGNGLVTLAWIANSLHWALSRRFPAPDTDAFDAMTVRELRMLWHDQNHYKHPLANRFIDLPQDLKSVACSVVALEAHNRK
jgi:SAM-dependent methyltransferase